MKQRVTVNKYHTYTGHKDCIYALEAIDEKRFVTAGGDGMVVLWSLDELEKGVMIAKVPNSVYALHFLKEEGILVVGQNSEGIHFIDIQNRKETGSLKLTSSSIFDIKSNGNYLLIATGDGEIIAINKKNLKVEQRTYQSSERARTILFVNETEVLIGYSDYKIRFFTVPGLDLKNEFKAHDNSVFCVRMHPLGDYILSTSRDAHLKIWNKKDLSLHEDIVAHMYAINDLSFSPDGLHFVTCSMDKSIKVWDSRTFRLKKVIDRARHAGHGTSVNKVRWMNYHNYVVSVSDDRTISVWDVKFDD
jgi:WD40 repeat protein